MRAEPGVELPTEEAAPPVSPPELPADWLAGLREQITEEMGMPEEAPTPVAEEMPTPAWLEDEGMPSGEEALAWLEQLTAGKEEELQAQAEVQAEARLAEIMGRPTPVEEAPPVEPPAEEAVAPRIEEPVAPPVEEPVGWTPFGEPGAPPEPAAAVEELPTPAWLEGEAMPSGEEALAWLEQLTAGKEEELQARAEVEAEARLAEIMGRPTPAEEVPPVEVPAEEAAAPPIEEPVAPPVEEPLGWTPFGEPEAPPEPVAAVEEAPPVEELATPAWLEGEAMPSGEEALAWLEQLTAGKEEELQAQAEVEAEARLAEIMGRPTPAEEPPPVEPPAAEAVAAPVEEPVAPPVEEPFGWTAFGEPAAPPEPVAEVEEVLPAEEAARPEMPRPAYPEEVEAPPVAEVPAAEEMLPAEEIPVPEAAPALEEVRWGAEWEVPAVVEEAPAPVVEEMPGVVEMEMPTPSEEVVARPEIPEAEAPAVEAPIAPLAAERAYLKDHPRDYEAWLALARSLWQAGEQEEALDAYTRVIRAGRLMESVIADLEEHVEHRPDASTQRVLGDAYMKDGRLQPALDVYRRALETL